MSFFDYGFGPGVNPQLKVTPGKLVDEAKIIVLNKDGLPVETKKVEKMAYEPSKVGKILSSLPQAFVTWVAKRSNGNVILQSCSSIESYTGYKVRFLCEHCKASQTLTDAQVEEFLKSPITQTCDVFCLSHRHDGTEMVGIEGSHVVLKKSGVTIDMATGQAIESVPLKSAPTSKERKFKDIK